MPDIFSVPHIGIPVPLIAFDGDSRCANGISGNAYTPIGCQGWVPALLKGRVETRPELTFGSTGNTTADLLARFDTTISTCATYGVGILVILISINDQRAGNLTWAQTYANLEAIRTKALNSGMIICWVMELTSGAAAYTSARLTATELLRLERTCRWIDARRFDARTVVADAREQLIDNTSATGDFLAGKTYDGVHPTQDGALALSRSIVTAITPFIPTASRVLPLWDIDAHHVTELPQGILNSAPTMLGTGGTTSAGGSTISGNVPDLWIGQAQNGTGLTNTFSKATVGGFEWAQCDISGTPSVGGPRVLFTSADFSAKLSAGDIIEGVSAFQIDAGYSGLASIAARLTLTYNTSSTLTYEWGSQPSYVGTDSAALDLVLRTPRMTIPAGTLNACQFRVGVNLLSGTAAAIIMRARCAGVRKIVSN